MALINVVTNSGTITDHGLEIEQSVIESFPDSRLEEAAKIKRVFPLDKLSKLFPVVVQGQVGELDFICASDRPWYLKGLVHNLDLDELFNKAAGDYKKIDTFSLSMDLGDFLDMDGRKKAVGQHFDSLVKRKVNGDLDVAYDVQDVVSLLTPQAVKSIEDRDGYRAIHFSQAAAKGESVQNVFTPWTEERLRETLEL